ncbi:MAG: homocysteine S-methyltransferase family protein [Spirochaetaceae bacterium]|jgi:5-methyltetrahydrofolate--homocysteine methyltransferase|nr:homocysteine S-methyltransferase family protein [Spirochaetaceae bacterium]
MNTVKTLEEIARRRILILDGAMGTMIQRLALTEADFRGGRFASHGTSLLGCNDVLCLTKPAVVESIHRAYLEAGADIIETCSLNAAAVSLAEYGLSGSAYEISAAAAGIARKAADAFSSADKPRFVAGSIGPTTKSAGIASDMNDLSKRSVTFDELAEAYYDNARGLLDGGADLLLIETVFDIINAKAAVFAVDRLREERRSQIPLMISATIANDSGRILSGQSVADFCAAVLHGDPWALGLNCSFGADAMEPHIRELAGLAPCLTVAYPNAGMPNRQGEYNETPQTMAASLERYMRQGLVNILGGCCGSTPAHIAAIAEKARGFPPRKTSGAMPAAAWRRSPGGGVAYIGDRTNAVRNEEFFALIKEEDYDEGVSIARDMLENGAALINVCVDGASPDAKSAITRFLNLALCYPGIAQAPIMVESSDWETIETALKLLPGKGLASSISSWEKEEDFLHKARRVRRYGAAVVVTLLDGHGRAGGYTRKTALADRSYKILTGNGFPPEDIVFDPVVLPVSEHDAADFIRACAWIRENCPGAAVLGNVSNLSIGYEDNEAFRDALYAVFLEHAAEAGLTLAVLDPVAGTAPEIESSLRQAAETELFDRKPD